MQSAEALDPNLRAFNLTRGLMSTDTYSFPIVILGGGFAGAYCARALRSGLRSSTFKSVALLADQNAMLFHPMLAEVSGSSISPLHVVNPLRRFCRGASIFMGSVEEVDLDQKTVSFSPSAYSPPAKLVYEHLVLAVGSVVDVSRVPGMAEHGYLMKTVGDAIRLRADVVERLEAASVISDESTRRRLLSFVIVGGGYSGVETAGQVWDLLRDVQRFYPRVDPKLIRLVLIHSGPHLLPQIDEDLGRYCEEQLRKRGIDLRLKTHVTAVTAERAILSTGEMIDANTVVSTVGNAANPVVRKLIDRCKLPNQKGRVITESTMQVKGYTNLWAAGDCAAVPLKDGSASPATAQFAMRQGTVLAENILALRTGRPLKPFEYTSMGEMASLGHRNAVGKVFGFKISGVPAWLMWRATYLYKLPGLEQKLKVFIEWNLDMLFSRDISLLNVNMTDTLGHVHLEKGDPVYHIGDVAFSFYLIEKGQVRIDDRSGSVQVLNAGEHFGERELLQHERRQFDAVATESTTLLALNKATFEALTQNGIELGYSLNRSSVSYLTLEERRALVDRVPAPMLQKRVKDYMQVGATVVHSSDSVVSCLQKFSDAGVAMVPVVDEQMLCKGWLMLDLVLDWLHQGKAKLASTATDLRMLPHIEIKPDDSIEGAMLLFARTPDRRMIVSNDAGRFVGILVLLDLILAAAAQPVADQAGAPGSKP